jgi:hypothetical protein
VTSQIFAISGVLGDGAKTKGLISYAVSLAGVDRPARFCFIPTAQGDHPDAVQWFEDAFGNNPAVEPSVLTLFTEPNVPDVRKHLLTQDVLWVGGGSVVNMMAVWRAHGRCRRQRWLAGDRDCAEVDLEAFQVDQGGLQVGQ